ncbi:MAG: SDR family oxidoreductase [Parasphingorhabdus sp.]|uniref:SDR family NAD(P)-dependent oxidoreductase n=1 Tax=Parasphingorhabdus sp. TaxID=2709688 RepID=UPI0030029123
MTGAPLEGKVALVVGGAGMIGGVIARRLSDMGAKIAIMDRNLASDDHVGDLELEVDLALVESFGPFCQQIVDDLGSLDILINAAGVTSLGSFGQITFDEWNRIQAINLRSVFLACQAAATIMREAGWGRIVNIGSVLGKNGGNPRPWVDESEQDKAANAAYGAAKAGVHALTLYLAKELAAHGVTVNAIAPGPIASKMTANFPETLIRQIPVGRMGRPEELAGLVAWICADEGSYMTGEIVDVNGGLWMD